MNKSFRKASGTVRILLLQLAVIGNSSPAQWQRLDIPTTYDIRDVHFADTSHGWVATVGGIYHTITGGGMWAIQDSLTSIRHLSSINERECWASSNSELLHTSDGGVEWYHIPASEFMSGVKSFGKVFFVDSLHGWVVVVCDTIYCLARTSDGGRNWERLQLPDIVGPNIPFFFVDSAHGWIASTFPSNLFRTSNGGDSWELLGRIGYNEITDLQFLNPFDGWAATDGLVQSSIVLKTSDGGYSWSLGPIFFCSSSLRTRLWFADTLEGWIAGYSCVGETPMEIHHTTDGGQTWDVFRPSDGFRPSRVFFVGTHHGWIVGDRGSILYTRNGGLTRLERGTPSVSADYLLHQNYPNPFNSATTISYSVPRISTVTIKVYDLLGHEVATIADELMAPGGRNARWDGTRYDGLPVASGIYICRMLARTSENQITLLFGKLTVLR